MDPYDLIYDMRSTVTSTLVQYNAQYLYNPDHWASNSNKQLASSGGGNNQSASASFSTADTNQSNVNSRISNLEAGWENANGITDGYTPFILPENNYMLDYLIKAFFTLAFAIKYL